VFCRDVLILSLARKFKQDRQTSLADGSGRDFRV